MSSTRQDAWSQDEDVLLAEVVLRQIRGEEHNFKHLKKWVKSYQEQVLRVGFVGTLM